MEGTHQYVYHCDGMKGKCNLRNLVLSANNIVQVDFNRILSANNIVQVDFNRIVNKILFGK